MELSDFLLARIAEDRSAVENARYDPADHWWLPEPAYPSRLLAECEAKRRIVAGHPIYRGPRILEVDSSGTDYGCELCHCIDPIRVDGIIEANGYCETLLLLALPYADHPEFRNEWRST